MATNVRNEMSSRYDPHALERRIYEEWESGGRFTADAENPAEPYTIVIPPPNVTGFLHVGHALNNALQDILTRWRRMQGRNTLWLPGTDHAGIATQHVVERALRAEGKDRRELGREAFLERVWAWKEVYGSRIICQLKRLGCSCDWSRERFTMDEGLSRAVATVFKRLYDEGLIYRGDYLVNWSPKLQTALSDDEVEHREAQGHLWHFKYPLEDGGGEIVVATTRPETMLGDTAVAVHPDDERYAAMHGKYVMLPLMNRRIPVIPDPFVDKAFGTGAVKVTPAHDPNDYEMGRRHDLEFINLLNPDGTLNDNAGAYAGLGVADARKRVVADMEALGLLLKIEPHTHSVGHCYRSGCVVEPYLSKQWFVKMRPLCGPAIEAVRDGRIEFVPKHYENIYFHWLENVRDWCISRQLWWGHRIPVFTCGACGHEWCEIETTPDTCPQCGAAEATQDPDVLDTWFSSQLWPFSTLGWPEKTKDLETYYPTSVLVTGFDIIFFWVARMIMMGLKFMDDVPYRKVVINPIVCDKHGKKMNKSAGNAIDPLEAIDEMGADTVRLAMCGYSMQTRHISLDPKQFERMRNFCNKLWNAARFVIMNTEDMTAETLAAENDAGMQAEDRWILSALRRTIAQATDALEAFGFDGYLDTVYKFIWGEYCDWYVELVKDRLYQKGDAGSGRTSDASRRAAQATLVTVLENTLRLLHPIAPFITEEIWQQLRGRWGEAGSAGGRLGFEAESTIVAPWPTGAPYDEDAASEASLSLVRQAIGAVRNIRGEMAVPPGEAANVEIVTTNADKRRLMDSGAHYVRSLVKIGTLTIGERQTLTGFTATNAFDDVTVHVQLPQALVEQERARLDKEIARLKKGVGVARGKLGNEKFVAGAPEAVVAAEREKLEKLETELATLKSKRQSLE